MNKNDTKTCRICGSYIHNDYHFVKRKGAINYYCPDCIKKLTQKGGGKK